MTMKSRWDSISTAGKVAGACITIITLTTMIVSAAWASYTHFETVKMATVAHSQLAAVLTKQEQHLATMQLSLVQEQMLKLEVEKIRVDNRTGLSEIEKKEQKAIFDQLIEMLKMKAECHKKGKLECDHDDS